MKRWKPIVKRTSIKYSYFIEYFLLSCVLIVISNVFFFMFQNTFKQVANDLQTSVYSQFIQEIDSNAVIMSQYAELVADSPVVHDFMLNEELSTETIAYKKYGNLQIDLVKQCQQMPSIEQCFLYFPEDDYMVSILHSAKTEMMYRIFSIDGMDYDIWHQNFTAETDSKFFCGNVINVNMSGFSQFYVKTMYEGNRRYNIILVKRVGLPKQTATVIYDKHGTVYQDKVLHIPADFDLTLLEDTFEDNESKEKYMVVKNRSAANDWSYLFFTPMNQYYNKFDAVKYLIWLFGLLTIFLSLLISWFLTRKNYRRVYSVIQKFGETGEIAVNEFDFLTEKIQSHTREYEKLLEVNNSKNKCIILNMLLKGTLPQGTESEQILYEHQIMTDKKNLILVMFRIDDCEELFPDGQYRGNASPLETMEFLIKNIGNDLFPEYEYYSCSEGNCVNLIICTNDASVCRLKQNVGLLQSNLRELLQVYSTVSLSSMHKSFFDLHEAEQECRYAFRSLNMMTSRQSDTMLIFEDLADKNDVYHYTEQDESKIINAITASEITNATEYINEVFDRNIAKNMLPDMMQLFISNITATIIKLSGRSLISVEIAKILTQQSHMENISNARNNILYAAKLLCEDFAGESEDYGQNLVDQILALVAENYGDYMLSVAFVSDRLNKSVPYISKVFKNIYGMNLSKYISNYRIHAAKEKMITTDKSVKEIAELVGYANVNVFISAFKKQEGITPGQWRENALKESEN